MYCVGMWMGDSQVYLGAGSQQYEAALIWNSYARLMGRCGKGS